MINIFEFRKKWKYLNNTKRKSYYFIPLIFGIIILSIKKLENFKYY